MLDTYTTNLSLKKPGYDSPADIADINANMDKIDTAVSQLKNEIAENKVIMIGDSYGVEHSWTGEHITPWCTHLKNFLRLGDSDCYVNALAGSGFTTTEVRPFIDLLNEISVEKKSHVKNIIVCGGYNDNEKTEEEIFTAMSAFCSRAKELYPNATVYLGMVGRGVWLESRRNLDIIVTPTYKRICELGGVYLQGVEYIMHDYKNMLSDKLHPNNEGEIKLARGIAQAFKSGFYKFSVNERPVTFTEHMSENNAEYEWYESMTDSEVVIGCKNEASINFAARDIIGSGPFKLGELPTFCCLQGEDKNNQKPNYAYGYTWATGSRNPDQFKLEFRWNGEKHCAEVYASLVGDDGTVLTGATTIYLTAFEAHLPVFRT